MTERERWIVYPLLFFALGAALRDKFTQQVTTDDLHAGKIWCEELNVVDSEKPDRIVAKLTSASAQPNNPDAARYGVFVLIDSEEQELCNVTNNQLYVNQIVCEKIIGSQFAVVDPRNPRMGLAVLGAAEIAGPDGASHRIGRLVLTDDQGQEVFGLADDQLKMRQVVCEGVAVVDPDDPRRTLAALGSIAAKPEAPNAKPQRFGVLALNNQQFGSLLGNPPRQPMAEPAPKTKNGNAVEQEAPPPSPNGP